MSPKRTTQPDLIPIDPLFAIPEGAEEVFSYTQNPIDMDDAAENAGDDFDEFAGTDYDYEDDGSADVEFGIIATPGSFKIVSQQLRRSTGGQQVVDIVVEIDDIDEAEDYRVQVAKS